MVSNSLSLSSCLRNPEIAHSWSNPWIARAKHGSMLCAGQSTDCTNLLLCAQHIHHARHRLTLSGCIHSVNFQCVTANWEIELLSFSNCIIAHRMTKTGFGNSATWYSYYCARKSAVGPFSHMEACIHSTCFNIFGSSINILNIAIILLLLMLITHSPSKLPTPMLASPSVQIITWRQKTACADHVTLSSTSQNSKVSLKHLLLLVTMDKTIADM